MIAGGWKGPVSNLIDAIAPSSRDGGHDIAALLGRVAELEARFAALTDGLDVGVIIHGPATEILFMNLRAAELLGANAEQLRGQTSFSPRWRALREDQRDFPASERPTATAFRTKAPQRAVVGIYRPETDDRVWLLVSAIPQLDQDGDIHQVVATFANITAQKEAEHRIQAQTDEILALSVPFIKVSDGVALMPIVGVLDGERAHRMLEVALTSAKAEGARVVLLDMTGVPAVTHEGVPVLACIADACKLVGAQIILTGLRCEPAKMLAQFDAELRGIPTMARLDVALPRVMNLKQG